MTRSLCKSHPTAAREKSAGIKRLVVGGGGSRPRATPAHPFSRGGRPRKALYVPGLSSPPATLRYPGAIVSPVCRCGHQAGTRTRPFGQGMCSTGTGGKSGTGLPCLGRLGPARVEGSSSSSCRAPLPTVHPRAGGRGHGGDKPHTPLHGRDGGPLLPLWGALQTQPRQADGHSSPHQ